MSMPALARPLAAWMVLVALGAILYDLQGPIMRQQLVMLLAWLVLRRVVGVREGQVKIWDRDINDQP